MKEDINFFAKKYYETGKSIFFDKLITSCESRIKTLINKYISPILPYDIMEIHYEDFIQIGFEKLITAANEYNPKENNNFWGFCNKRIRGSILDYLRKFTYYDQKRKISRHYTCENPIQYETIDECDDVILNLENKIISNHIKNDFFNFLLVNKLVKKDEMIIYDLFIYYNISAARLGKIFYLECQNIYRIIGKLKRIKLKYILKKTEESYGRCN